MEKKQGRQRADLTGEHMLGDIGQIILALHYISRHEEKLLLSRFGDEYAQYMREVGMWFPRIRKK